MIVEFEWDAPSTRNGSFNYILAYSAEQANPYPTERIRTAEDSFHINESSTESLRIEDALPYANYTVTIFAFNIKRGLRGPNATTMMRSDSRSKRSFNKCVHTVL